MRIFEQHTDTFENFLEGKTEKTVCFYSPRAIPTELVMPRQERYLVRNRAEITPELIFSFATTMQAKWQEITRIEGLEREVLLLKERITQLEMSAPVCIPIEIRAEVTDFGRSKAIAWYHLGGFGIEYDQAADTRICKWDSAS